MLSHEEEKKVIEFLKKFTESSFHVTYQNKGYSEALQELVEQKREAKDILDELTEVPF